MSALWVVVIVLCIGGAGILPRCPTAESQTAGTSRTAGVIAHSLPRYHGWRVFIFAIAPAIILFLIWSAGSQFLVEQHVREQIPTAVSDPATATLSVGMVESIAAALARLDLSTPENAPKTFAELQSLALQQNIALPANGEDYMIGVALDANSRMASNKLIGTALALIAALAGVAYAVSGIRLRLRARNHVERWCCGRWSPPPLSPF